ncbi:hypothetical protein L0Y40_00425 [Candidatus Wolfebacteria bacterium]|nr:hypothetical protein [Candidatus Wolfebacteria bacterium]
MNKTSIAVIVILIVLALLLFSQTNDTSDTTSPVSYMCENGALFTIKLLISDELEIVTNDAIHTATRWSDSPQSIRAYSDGHYAYTFVDGYSDQIIVTVIDDDTGPRSTICHASSDIHSEGKLNLVIQADIMETVSVADAEENYQRKILNNEYFVFRGSVTDNGQELAGYFKDGQVYKITYSLGLSYAVKKYLYYFDDGDLVFVYEEENNYPYVEEKGGLDYGRLEFAFGAVYFFQEEKLVMRRFKGERRSVYEEETMADVEAKLLADAERHLKMLSEE